MRKTLGSIILFIFGWKASYPTQYKFPKLLMVAAPHTSNWDLVFTFASYWKLGLYPNFMIYDRVTKGLVGYFFRKAGAMGVYKNERTSVVDYVVNRYNEHINMSLVITPEGSKDRVDKWKTGFFHIAKEAEVPLCLGHLNYKTKTAAIDLLSMSGDFEKDMKYIEEFYKNTNPKYPERYNKNIF